MYLLNSLYVVETDVLQSFSSLFYLIVDDFGAATVVDKRTESLQDNMSQTEFIGVQVVLKTIENLGQALEHIRAVLAADKRE